MIDIPIYCNSEWTTIIELEHLVELIRQKYKRYCQTSIYSCCMHL